MRAALMVPCYIELFYPRVGVATLELLERLGDDVVYPKDQTCCGQPMANSGCYEEARATEEHCVRVFGSFDCVITPSGSCTHSHCHPVANSRCELSALGECKFVDVQGLIESTNKTFDMEITNA